tara:strand:- start:307 stop:498 length:192 start_codon:yes stop_codon:yes gene_type:complete
VQVVVKVVVLQYQLHTVMVTMVVQVVVKQVVQKDHKDQVTLLQQLPLKETMVDLDLEEDNFLI